MNFIISSSINPVNPSTLTSDGFGLSDQNIIPSENISGFFDPEKDKIEFFIYDTNNNIILSEYNFTDWSIIEDPNIANNGEATTLSISPDKDVINRGYSNGDFFALYNFISDELNSSPSQQYYISEISSDRTEIEIKSNILDNETIESTFNEFKSRFDSSEFFDEFYLNFGFNQYYIGVNIALNTSSSQYSIFIKLYEPLPTQFNVKDEVYIVTKVAETQAFKISLIEKIPFQDEITYLKGPNTNLSIKDIVNNSTNLKNKNELLLTTITSSNYQLQSILNEKGISLSPNYSIDTFDEFVHFSSAEQRILNFYNKVSQIQEYENSLNIIYSITGSTSSSLQVSSSVLDYTSRIENIIKNFDGYEYFLYYTSGSDSYPKSGSIFPYTLYPTGSVETLTWLGSSIENTQYYGGILLSASIYDNKNQNYLYYTIPEFIRENSDNSQYIEFINMMGQHFDEIWLYTKAVTDKLNATNVLDDGVPLELAENIVNSFGYEIYGNNFNNSDNYMSLIGISPSGGFAPPVGNELITQYIAVNSGEIINYWFNNSYSLPNYVQQIIVPGFPYPIDDVSKEIFKRLYHNLVYLAKKKGTISGLRQLINIWGVPDTILRINEFGGKNKDNTNDYDAWYNRYSYAYSPILGLNDIPNSSVRIPWQPLERNRINDSEYIVPDSIEFRFKTGGIPSSSFISQSLLVKKSDNATSTDFDFGIQLLYTGSLSSGSYSGSIIDDYSQYGNLKLIISGAASDGGTAISSDIYLPFFDGGWWSIMLQRDTHPSASNNSLPTTYTLYAKNKIYNGYDGNQIGYQGSASIISNVSSSINEAWNKFDTGSINGIYLGGYISGSVVGGINISNGISLSTFQEFRYYGNPISESVFDSYVMNPESIEGLNITGSLSSFDIVNFRAPLGNELENTTSSFHPASSGLAPQIITSSFVNPGTNVTSSNYEIIYYGVSSSVFFPTTNVEAYYLNQPAVGIRNAINNKIQVVDNNNYGNVLSLYKSIQQDYEVSQSYTEDINNLEVSFSPQDEVNDDIIQSIGAKDVSETMSDPRFINSNSEFYPYLRKISENYFEKYSKGNIYDYIRLIKYIDNSLFKAIKNYVPARTSVSTGVVIKQHLLERNRYKVPNIGINTKIATVTSSSFNTPYILQNIQLDTNIHVGNITGSTGGSLNKFNYSGSPEFGEINNAQSWVNSIPTVYGLQNKIENSQKEFYDGAYSGSIIEATDGELNQNNPYKYQSNISVLYEVREFSAKFDTNFRTCPESTFLNDQSVTGGFLPPVSTAVAAGELYIWSENPNTLPGPNYTKYIKISPTDDIFSINLDPAIANLKSLIIQGVRYTVSSKQRKQFDWILTLDNSTPAFSVSSQGQLSSNVEVIFEPFIQGPSFDNSDFNPIINNYNENRKNSFVYDVDYTTDYITPVNLQAILSGSAIKAQIPDSNYTSKKNILPRYEGSRVSSADYNFYTPSSSYVKFLNGDTGSWDGDASYGKTATIDKYSQYFAYFDWIGNSNPEVLGGGNIHTISLIGENGEVVNVQSKDDFFFLEQIFQRGSNPLIYYISSSVERGTTIQANVHDSGVVYDTVLWASASYIEYTLNNNGGPTTYGESGPYISGSFGKLEIQADGTLGLLEAFFLEDDPNGLSWRDISGSVIGLQYNESYLPIQTASKNDFIRIGTSLTLDNINANLPAITYTIIGHTPPAFATSESIQIYPPHNTQDLQLNINQTFRIFRRVPSNFVVIKPNVVGGSGFLIPENYNPNLNYLELAKKAGFL